MKKVVLIGGGTGTGSIARELKNEYEVSIIMTMSDSGGSTGILREKYGIPPVGDIRQALGALARDPDVFDTLNERYEEGENAGHTYGNLLICETIRELGFEQALQKLSQDFKILGNMYPASIESYDLCANLKTGEKLTHEEAITNCEKLQDNIEKIFISPEVTANPEAIESINSADIIVIGPGNLYGSITPALLPTGISEALINTPAKKVYIGNSVNRPGQTNGWTVSEYLQVLAEIIGKDIFDIVVANSEDIAGEDVVGVGKQDHRYVCLDMFGEIKEANKVDPLKNRNRVFYDTVKVANVLREILRPKIILWDLDDTLYPTIRTVPKNGNEHTVEDLEGVELFPGAQELLENKNFTHIMVTRGGEVWQNTKRDYFELLPLFKEWIVVPDHDSKGREFEKFKEQHSDTPLFAIGDRIDSELEQAKKLSIATLRLLKGKYKDLTPQNDDQIPDGEISDISYAEAGMIQYLINQS